MIEGLWKEREDIIKVNGMSSKDRIMKDTKIRDLRAETE
mgnify:CR=1 FL=1